MRLPQRLIRAILLMLALSLASGCGGSGGNPSEADLQRAMTWSLKKAYSKNFALPGGDNFFAPAPHASSSAPPPFVATVTRRTTREDGGEHWQIIEFSALGHLESGDVTFRGTVAMVKRGSTWFFRREPSAGG
jgi:hypothetical protein